MVVTVIVIGVDGNQSVYVYAYVCGCVGGEFGERKKEVRA